MNGGALLGIWLSFSQDLAGDGGCVAFTEEYVAYQVNDRVPLRPAEVAVRPLAGRVSQVKKEGGVSAGFEK
jgi:hypothetical protein